jgi:cyclopropane fatty-acyl-phospholipid synthase-like methyltransferase
MSNEISVEEADASSRKFWDWSNAATGLPQNYPDEEVVRFLMPHKGKPLMVLDLGAGTGKNSGVIVDLGMRAICADYSVNGLNYINSRYAGRAIETCLSDFTAGPLPFAEESFDLIVAIEIFDHVLKGQARQLASEASRVLKRGGQMLATLFTTNTTRKSKSGTPVTKEKDTVLVSSGRSAGEIHSFFDATAAAALFDGLPLSLLRSMTSIHRDEQTDEVTEGRYFVFEKVER